MDELLWVVQQIGGISGIAGIAGIATHTKPLALYSAIKAACCGETGLGFSVVVWEVHGLVSTLARLRRSGTAA